MEVEEHKLDGIAGDMEYPLVHGDTKGRGKGGLSMCGCVCMRNGIFLVFTIYGGLFDVEIARKGGLWL